MQPFSVIYDTDADCRSREVADLRDYWTSQLNGRRMPRLADIDLERIRPLLPSLIITEYVGDPARVLYRYVGPIHAHYNARDFTGGHLDEMAWSEREFLARVHDTLRRTAAPVFGYFYWDFREHFPGLSEFGFFPLSEDGRTVSHAIGYEDCSDFERQLGRSR